MDCVDERNVLPVRYANRVPHTNHPSGDFYLEYTCHLSVFNPIAKGDMEWRKGVSNLGLVDSTRGKWKILPMHDRI